MSSLVIIVSTLYCILRFLNGCCDNGWRHQVGCVCDEIWLLPGPTCGLRQHGKWKRRYEWVRKARCGLAKVQRENHPVLSLERTWYLGFSAAFNVIGHLTQLTSRKNLVVPINCPCPERMNIAGSYCESAWRHLVTICPSLSSSHLLKLSNLDSDSSSTS